MAKLFKAAYQDGGSGAGGETVEVVTGYAVRAPSASKAVTAMLVHLRDAQNLIRLDHPVSDYTRSSADRVFRR